LVSFQNGGIVLTNTIEWTIVNVLDSPDLMIRKGDSLRLTAFPPGITNGNVTIEIAGVATYSTTVDSPAIHIFINTGTFTVNAEHNDGTVTTGSITVKVVDCPTPASPIAAWRDKNRLWMWSAFPQEAVLDATPPLNVSVVGEMGGARILSITASHSDTDEYILARLGDGGPILSSARVETFWLHVPFDAFWHDENYPDGTEIFRERLMAWNLPSTVTVQLRIFVGGVTFDDGTIIKNITASDFDDLEEYEHQIIKSASCYTGPCHYIRVYQEGVLLGNR